MVAPVFTDIEKVNRETFLALMWAFSYPGRVQTLTVSPNESLVAIGAALLDLETNYYTPDADLDTRLSHTTARTAPIENAEYIFYPSLNDADLTTIAQASIGEMLFPDRAATLIIGATFGAGVSMQLSGPGIQGSATVQIGGLPAGFWALRERTRRYPLGWDIFLIDGANVLGIPRSTAIMLIDEAN